MSLQVQEAAGLAGSGEQGRRGPDRRRPWQQRWSRGRFALLLTCSLTVFFTFLLHFSNLCFAHVVSRFARVCWRFGTAFAIGTDDLIHANAGRLAQMHLPVSGRRGQIGTQAMKQGEITLAYPADGFATVRANLSGDLGSLAGRVMVSERSPTELSATDPWGQAWRLIVDEGGQHAAAAVSLGTHPESLHLTPLPVGIPRVDVACPVGSAPAIADFYAKIFHATASAR